MFLLYHSNGCNTSETVFYWCYVNDLHTTHAVVCWVTARQKLVHLFLCPFDFCMFDMFVYHVWCRLK
jgi:hypothetical protein